ncbi:glycosyltransferase family 4 protein [Planococcus sp. CAU13]|uniref:glycosyltransferase family 4 protein n=1 Tax=Planococcus sp. CAU13 TaxID=1541197 RepID=UPI0009E003D3|nr:glycosyltransferase family 4 protein [Planococcus sp. CAU13]
MEVVFITLGYPDNGGHGDLYYDLMQEFKHNGHGVTVVCQTEKRHNRQTELSQAGGITVLKVRTGNVTKSGLVEKGVSTLLLEDQFINAIRTYLGGRKFDLIIYTTPPITFERVIRYLKNMHGDGMTYLLLKDIFPQNAVDIGMMKENSLLHSYFRRKEKRLYEISDMIGCMSEGNRRFVLGQNPDIPAEKVEVNPNSIHPADRQQKISRTHIRKKLGIPEHALLFLYGGNLGKPQGIDYLIRSIDLYRDQDDVFFLIVGSGTEFPKIENYIRARNPGNVRLENFMPKEDYGKVVHSADVGMIYLDRRFTIPNIPSRLMDYMDSAKPVLAVTDPHTDLKDIIFDARCGYYAEAGELAEFRDAIEQIKRDRGKLRQLGENGRRYLEKEFNVTESYDIIMRHFIKDGSGEDCSKTKHYSSQGAQALSETQ